MRRCDTASSPASRGHRARSNTVRRLAARGGIGGSEHHRSAERYARLRCVQTRHGRRVRKASVGTSLVTSAQHIDINLSPHPVPLDRGTGYKSAWRDGMKFEQTCTITASRSDVWDFLMNM